MSVGDRVRVALQRVRRVERREMHEFRTWMETTRNLLHLSVLLLVPLLIALVTAISNVVPTLSFLLFPPLAAGTYTLFANPRGKYASPVKFVGGLTIGAICGWFALVVQTALFFDAGRPVAGVDPGGAALSIFLVVLVTWALGVEIPAAFSTALLVLVTGSPSNASIYVLSIAASSTLVAIVFVLWRREVYTERAQYLYRSTKGDDHVLVPMRGQQPAPTAMLAARLAAAHDAGKVVLLDLVSEDDIAAADRRSDLAERGPVATENVVERTEPVEGSTTDDSTASESGGASERSAAQQHAAAAFATDLEERAATIRTRVGVPCEVVVASEGANPSQTVLRTAHQTNCDLIATPYETHRGALSPFIRELFVGDTDVLVHRSVDGRTRWKDVLVSVRRAGSRAHGMLDFAARLVGRTGRVSVCHCIASERERRRAEEMLADLTETMAVTVETRVSRSRIEEFLASCAPSYDLVIIGASQDRSAASRFISPPTFERIDALECDVAILDRNVRI